MVGILESQLDKYGIGKDLYDIIVENTRIDKANI